MNWSEQIALCMEEEGLRHYLAGLSIMLLSAVEFELAWFYWIEYGRENRN